MTQDLIFGLALGMQVAGWLALAVSLRWFWRQFMWDLD